MTSQKRRIILRIAALLVCVGWFASLGAQSSIPLPTVDPVLPNVFYGANHPFTNPKAPVLVFVHGLNGTASDWWLLGDMYEKAYQTGYRTAFLSMSVDNTRNSADIKTNATVLAGLLPQVAAHFGTNKLYLVGHSKGALDIQGAMLVPQIAALTRAVVTISAPNSGTELADWAFANPAVSGPLGLLTPAVASLRTASMTAFRTIADPVLEASGIPFYTFTGSVFYDSQGTLITGSILRSITGNVNADTNNDGLVTVARSRLPGRYSSDLGTVPTNHFKTNGGTASFYKIHTVVQGIELTFSEFQKIAADGLSKFGGDDHNSWAWSMDWFKGHLYVGTGREALCSSLLTSDVRAGSNIYPSAIQSTQCPTYSEFIDSLGAEIWRYTVETDTWQRVYKSQNDYPVTLTVNGVTTSGMTARDVGFRGMEVHVESDGTEALYVGSVTSGSIFEPTPFQPNGFPAPRILRSIDGINWAPLPADPGTFLGEAGNVFLNPTTKPRSFRSLVSYNGKLFASMADFIGVGVVIEASEPQLGNNAWHYASTAGSNMEDFPVWSMKRFNNQLYATTGLTRDQDPDGPGYGVYRTDASGPAPYTWTPVITNGGWQPNLSFQAPNGLSMEVFKNQLYVGTNRPTELVRINADDTWDLVVGEPRMTPAGFKTPVSGMGNGFGNGFNGHFWRMATYGDNLYLLTWDWSVGIQAYSFFPFLDKMFSPNYGFNIYRTNDGVDWTAVTHTGLHDVNNSGGRSIQATPLGLFIGTARQRGGMQIFKTLGPAPDPAHLPAPKNLTAASEFAVGRNTVLTWDPSPGAVRYQVYRAQVKPIDELIPLPEITAAANEVAPSVVAAAADTSNVTFPLPYGVIAAPAATTFMEPAPTSKQSLYFVRAQDAQGNLSPPSNLVGGPSKATSANALPVAVCQARVVPCSNGNCTADAIVDGGSFDPNNGTVIVSQEPAGPYPLGVTNVTLTATVGPRTAQCSTTVTVQDLQAPTATAPGNVTVPNDSGQCGATVNLGVPTYGDNCTIVNVTNDAPLNNFFPVGVTVVTWTFSDPSGNQTTKTQNVTVVGANPGCAAPATYSWNVSQMLTNSTLMGALKTYYTTIVQTLMPSLLTVTAPTPPAP